MQAKLEQQERELGGALQRAQASEEDTAQVREEAALLGLQKAEADRLQGMHADHAHIFRHVSICRAPTIA